MLEGLTVLIESLPTSVFWGVYFLIELVNLYYMTRFLGYTDVLPDIVFSIWDDVESGIDMGGFVL